jgi:hypothetical protein
MRENFITSGGRTYENIGILMRRGCGTETAEILFKSG